MSKQIVVGYNTKPVFKFALTTFRDESDPNGVVDITGYNFKLSVKRARQDLDSLQLIDLAGAIVDAANGVFSFTLTQAHTTLPPGVYTGQISWWSGAVTSTPDDSWTVEYTVNPPVDRAFV